MRKRMKSWHPVPGDLATYVGRSARLIRDGRALRVLAEAVDQHTIVEAIGKSGMPVRMTVKTKNLARAQPQLFD